MALSIFLSVPRYRMIISVNQCVRNSLTKQQKQFYRELRICVRTDSSKSCGFLPQQFSCQPRLRLLEDNFLSLQKKVACSYSSSREKTSAVDDKNELDENEPKLTTFQRFKLLFKKYWYIVLPVHAVTSAIWFGSFYVLAKNGLNVAEIIEYCGAPESWVDDVRNSNAGPPIAAYALYKVITPLRYTVTIGFSTLALKYLRKFGYATPAPVKGEFRKFYEEKKGAFKDKTSSYYDKFRIKEKVGEAFEKIQGSVIDTQRSIQDIARQDAQNLKDMKKSVSEFRKRMKEGPKSDYVAEIIEINKCKKK